MRGLVSWRGAGINNPLNARDNVGAYALVNLYAGIRAPNGSWEVTAFVKNAFNTIRIVSREDTALTPSGVSRNARYGSLSTTAPREFGITARVAIGSR